MADFDQNVDVINWTGLPVYEKVGTQGLQITFTSEVGYVEPYDLTDFKDYARIDFDTDDNLLTIFLKAARIDVERYLQKSLGIRTISLTALKLPKNYVLPYGPVESVSTTGYTKVGDILKEGGTDVVIEYVTNASLVNDSITKAIYAQALHYYEYRDKFSKLQGTVVDEVKMCLYSFKRLQFP
jgi:hypothetical protein